MKTLLNLGLLTALTASLLAAETPPAALSVAVYDFKGKGPAASFGNNVTALVTANLTTESNIIMLERAELKKALSEQAFGVSGLVSADAAAKIGAMTGAKVLVSGQVIMIEQHHLVIIANIIGTETGRLFAAKVEGDPKRLSELSLELGSKIAQTITSQTTNLIMLGKESTSARLDRIVKNIAGAHRPSVSVNIHWARGVRFPSSAPNSEWGLVLQKAGFVVVDGHSDRKSDVEITGVDNFSSGPRHGELFSSRAVIELKVQERRTGNIIAIDRQEAIATDATKVGADRAAQVQAVDGLAERILPLLAK